MASPPAQAEATGTGEAVLAAEIREEPADQHTIAPCQGDAKQSPGVWNYDFQQPYACFNLADGSTGTWSMAGTPPMPALSYTGGDACYNVQPASTYTLQVAPLPSPRSPREFRFFPVFLVATRARVL